LRKKEEPAKQYILHRKTNKETKSEAKNNTAIGEKIREKIRVSGNYLP
jgi:hypothetical protein